jgi:hypothetical protein
LDDSAGTIASISAGSVARLINCPASRDKAGDVWIPQPPRPASRKKPSTCDQTRRRACGPVADDVID